jgi:hypothetical protein
MRYLITNLPVNLTHEAVTALAAALGVTLISSPCIVPGVSVEVEVAAPLPEAKLTQLEETCRAAVIANFAKIVPVPEPATPTTQEEA